MNRRNFLALSFLGPLLVLPKLKPEPIELPPLHYKYPMMDRFVNDEPFIDDREQSGVPYWKRPCSKPRCPHSRDYWVHNG